MSGTRESLTGALGAAARGVKTGLTYAGIVLAMLAVCVLALPIAVAARVAQWHATRQVSC